MRHAVLFCALVCLVPTLTAQDNKTKQQVLKFGDISVSIESVEIRTANRHMAVTFLLTNNHPTLRLKPPKELQNTVAYDEAGNKYNRTSFSGIRPINPGETERGTHTFALPVPKVEEVFIQLGSIAPNKKYPRFTVPAKAFVKK